MIHIAQASLQQKDKLGKFIISAFGEIGRFKFPERWDWLFSNNPFIEGPDPAIQIALFEDQVVAQFCAMAVKMQINKQQQVGYWGLDFMIDEPFRGGALGKALLETLFNKTNPLIALWSSAATQKLYAMLGGRTVCSVIQFEKFTQWNLSGTLPPPHTRDTKNGVEIVGIEEFGDEIDSLWNELSPLYGNLVVRDSKYLNWKFKSVPFSKNLCFLAKENGCTRGYVILRQAAPPELKAGMIADVFASPRELHILRALYEFGTAFLEHQQVDSLVAANSHPMHQRVLKELGYFSTKKMPVLMLAKDNSPKSTPEGGPADWLIGRGDSDWDQYPASLSRGALSAGLVVE